MSTNVSEVSDLVVAYANYEGEATGFETVMGTLGYLIAAQLLVRVHGQVRHSRQMAHGPAVSEQVRGLKLRVSMLGRSAFRLLRSLTEPAFAVKERWI